MRLRIWHRTNYRYETPATSVTQMLRLTPRNHESQYVAHWRIDISIDCWLHQHEDAFGNITHAFSTTGTFEQLAVTVEGEIETRDTQGVMRGTVERFPPSLYLRETALTAADTHIAGFAASCRNASGDDALKLMHLMVERLHAEMAYDTDPTHAATTAAEAFALKRGVCQDLTHIFISAARKLGIPARYVGGYFCREDGVTEQEAGHAWAEAFVPELGWVGFDAANGICSTDAHVRVAVGLDYLGAAPLRGVRSGGRGEELSVNVRVAQAATQTEN
ncbi:MAG: transglutaminase family protein [Alphaproteobacteria bacterium]|nr:MAG: transglutaminase family protein [Alphaproteobacteria bacterium]